MHYYRKNETPVNIVNSSLIDLPTMSNLSNMWNFGSTLGIVLGTQILSGIFLAMHYSSEINLSFIGLTHLEHDITGGWFLRLTHSNGASFFFFLIFIHMSRSLYYNSYSLKQTWNTGVIILFISMATAFLGYVLPWGQMSFWGATVITNLLSAIPQIGNSLVIWIWGGFSVGNPTLNRFFSFHYLTPFIMAATIIMHLVFLHENKSSNPLGTNKSVDKIPFMPYFHLKDLTGISLMFILFFLLLNLTPYIMMDSENFNKANPLTTPNHIQPEWYFLFAYAILRAVPNKLGGVLALFMSIFSLIFLSFKNQNFNYKNKNNKKIIFWNFCLCFLMLTWMGMKPVEQPFVAISQIFSLNYFFSIIFWLMNYFVEYFLFWKQKKK